MVKYHNKQGRETRRQKQPPGFEEGILSRALEHPALGPQRLAVLLKSEGVIATKSEVYRVLHRKRLQTRKLREEFLAQKKPQDETSPVVTPAENKTSELVPKQPADAQAIYPSASDFDESPRKSETPSAIPNSSAVPVTAKRSQSIHGNSHTLYDFSGWAFLGADLLLVILVVVFGIQIADLLRSGLGTPPSQAIASTAIPAKSGSQQVSSIQPQTSADSYRVIVERNLFKSASVEKDEKDAGIAQIKIAGPEVGLKLIGTTVSKKSGMSQAVIESVAQRTQEMYHEYERVGKVLIKRILRNNVVIETDKGELRLTMDYEKIMLQRNGRGETDAENPSGAIMTDTGPEKPQGGTAGFTVPKASFSLSPTQAAMYFNQMGIDPALQLSSATGLSLELVTPSNPLSLLGMVTGDVIRKVDVGGAELSELDIETMYKIFAQGGDFNVLLERSGRPMQLGFSLQ